MATGMNTGLPPIRAIGACPHLSGADCIQCMNSVYADGSFRADDFRSAAASGLASLAGDLVISRRICVGALVIRRFFG
jgi:hypothetical protein